MLNILNIYLYVYLLHKHTNTRSEHHTLMSPLKSRHAWDVEFVPDESYFIKPVNGVFHIYNDKVSSTRNNSPSALYTYVYKYLFDSQECTSELDFSYPDMNQFVNDMQVMCNMIADGPL